ncbi:hypothetical protein D9M72_411760 [compost metagenome]
MKPRLIIGHIPLDIAELDSLETFLVLIPCRIERKAMGVQMRVRSVALDRSCRLVRKFRPDKLVCFPVGIFAAFTHACHGIPFDLAHGVGYALLEHIHDLAVSA